MNNKYLISTIIPEIQETFNIYIPNNKKLGTIKNIILNAITELSGGYYVNTIDHVIFVDRDTGKTYDNNDMYVKDCGIKNGTKIIII